MNKSLTEGLQLIDQLNEKAANTNTPNVEIIIGTPFIHLAKAVEAADSKIAVAAQNCAAESSGAYTGEVSAEMIASTGAKYVILGHSERREYYGETDEILVKKVTQVLTNRLTPIFCIGEVLAEREANRHFEVVKEQIEAGLFHLDANAISQVILAYEPVWAIGTGVTASPAQAQEMHAHIRNIIAAKYGEAIANGMSILYGGSMKPSNAAELIANPDVDGGLIGGASLDADDFFGIATAF